MNLSKFQNDRTFFIHYACGNFFTEENPIISAIAIKPYGKSVETFSIAKEASEQGINIEDGVDRVTIEYLESLFLEKFYKRVESRIQDEVQWIHWNMINQEYSWKKINGRISHLGVDDNPIEPNSKDSHDLSELFQEKYHEKFVQDKKMKGYEEHETEVREDRRKGKLYNLTIINNMMRDDFLSGREEYELLLEGKGFLRIQASTVRKVQYLEEFLKRDVAGKLKVQKKASIPKRIKRKLLENPLIAITFATAISFLGSLIPIWAGISFGLLFAFLTIWLFVKE